MSPKPGTPGVSVTAGVWIAISSVRGPDKNWTAPLGGEPILVEDAQQSYRARWRVGEYKLECVVCSKQGGWKGNHVIVPVPAIEHFAGVRELANEWRSHRDSERPHTVLPEVIGV